MQALVDMGFQHARLVTIACAGQPALIGALQVERFHGHEGVNALFRFDVDVVSSAADLDLDALIGAAVALFLLQPDGSRRAWHGQCVDAGPRGADGGLARYRLRIAPALAQLQQRRDSHVYQDVDVRAIVADLLSDYPDVQCGFDVTGTLTQRAVCTQYRETDFAFFCRLLVSEGLNWRFDHAADGSAHTLLIFDAAARIPALPGGARLRFHGVRATDVDDAIDGWHARRRVQANGIALSRWVPARMMAPSAEQKTLLDAGDLPLMAVYDGSGEASATDDPIGHGRLMMQALEAANKVCDGAGAVRRLAPGHGFTLTGHAHYPDGDNGFTVLSVTHTARNNLRTGIKGAAADADEPIYRNRFACVRASVPLVPAAAAAPHPCTASGIQVALVVGVPQAVSSTTRDHQVKVQFSWQRGDAPNAGGLEHPGTHGGNAPGNADSGTWVRVSEALAGPNWGSQFTPRIGTEVLVTFIEGDIDRPVIVGQVHNGLHPPPFPAGADSPANHAGVLSGIHTRNIDGAGHNQWQLDDTPSQLRMRLASSRAASELHLGHLVQQNIGSASRGGARGTGFELRTDTWAVLRGGDGVLLSTSARPALGSGITSTQMDAQEALAVSRGAAALNDALAQAAAQQHALYSQDATKAQRAFSALHDPAATGKYPGPVNGQAPVSTRAGTREPDSAHPVERLGAAAVLFDAAAAMSVVAPGSNLFSAGQQVHWTTQSDLHVAAGTSISSVAGTGASLFAHGGGIKAIAGNGPLSLQAHTGALELIADKEVVVVSVKAAIAVSAKTKIVLQAGQSSITLEGGDITFACPGEFTAKGGQKVFDGGGRQAVKAVKLPDSRMKLFDQAFILRDKSSGEPVPRQPYRLMREDESYEEGFTDELGQTHIIGSAESEPVAIELVYSPKGQTSPEKAVGGEVSAPKFKKVSETVTTPVDDKKRHKVLVDLTACWIDDYEAEIGVQPPEQYSATQELDGEELEFSIQIKYKIYIPVKSDQGIVVEVKFKIVELFFTEKEKAAEDRLPYDAQIRNKRARQETVEAMKLSAERGVRLGWSNKFRMEIFDPICGFKALPITYQIRWVESGEHYSMNINEATSEKRENVRMSAVNVWLDTSAWIFAHEFGHCVGLPDEYSTSAMKERMVTYYKPDGTADLALTARIDGEPQPESDKTIMSIHSSIVLKPRHAWNIAIEVGKLLTEKIGRKIKCDIKLL